jgi:hypothetical protein
VDAVGEPTRDASVDRRLRRSASGSQTAVTSRPQGLIEFMNPGLTIERRSISDFGT